MSTPEEPQPPEENELFLYKVRTYGWIIALIFTPIISIGTSWVTASYTAKAETARANIEMVQLAVEVVQDENASSELKEWALKVISTYSGIRIASLDLESIVENLEQVGMTIFAPQAPINPDGTINPKRYQEEIEVWIAEIVNTPDEAT